jgi:hypothetical protein
LCRHFLGRLTIFANVLPIWKVVECGVCSYLPRQKPDAGYQSPKTYCPRYFLYWLLWLVLFFRETWVLLNLLTNQLNKDTNYLLFCSISPLSLNSLHTILITLIKGFLSEPVLLIVPAIYKSRSSE